MENSNFETSTQYFVYKELFEKHGVELTDEQLQTIDDVYIEERKTAIFFVGMYRFINFVVSLSFLLLIWLVPGTVAKWVFIVSFAVYGLYSLIHLWNNVMDYKSIRKTNFKPFRVEPRK